MKLKKGSAEAKRFMAKIRAMKSGAKKKAPKKIGATKFFENNKETKSSKPKRNISVERRSDGTFKKFDDSVLQARRLKAKLKAKKNKSKISGVHKDTKSHNVKISVMSGNSLTPTQKRLYVKILNEFEKTGFYKITTLENYIELKYENAIKKHNTKLSDNIYYVLQWYNEDNY